MKKAFRRVVFFGAVEAPLIAITSYISTRVKQLTTKYSDEELKAMIADKLTGIHERALFVAALRQQMREAESAASSAHAGHDHAGHDHAGHGDGLLRSRF